MGLDMMLYRMPRYKDATAKDVTIVEEYLGWKREKDDPNSEYKNCTMKKWCGIDYKEVKRKFVNFYKKFYHVTYSDWDTDHKYPWHGIKEKVGYWRKANEIHNWFVGTVQDGIDDCDWHNEVTKEDLIYLKDTCEKVLSCSNLIDGKINNGYHFENGKEIPNVIDGKCIEDPRMAQALLPTCSGFFFGGTDYDEYYIENIRDTIDICNKVLETTDFETQMVYYRSSW